jgi:hypothetical protein
MAPCPTSAADSGISRCQKDIQGREAHDQGAGVRGIDAQLRPPLPGEGQAPRPDTEPLRVDDEIGILAQFTLFPMHPAMQAPGAVQRDAAQAEGTIQGVQMPDRQIDLGVDREQPQGVLAASLVQVEWRHLDPSAQCCIAQHLGLPGDGEGRQPQVEVSGRHSQSTCAGIEAEAAAQGPAQGDANLGDPDLVLTTQAQVVHCEHQGSITGPGPGGNGSGVAVADRGVEGQQGRVVPSRRWPRA